MKRQTVPYKTGKNKNVWNKRTLTYCAAILTSAVLILSALWLPQVFFEFSDALMYGKVNLMEQEKLDVLTLTADYEASLYRRLANFAEGLAGQRQYYVDEQTKEVTEEIQVFLDNKELDRNNFHGYGIYEDMVMGLFLSSLGLSPNNFVKTTGMELYQWKQYVIYSDDYARGVNFILWCFGFQNASGDAMTILMDANDYTVYAVQMTSGATPSRNSTINNKLAEPRINFMQVSTLLWIPLNFYYEVFDETERVAAEFGAIYEAETVKGPFAKTTDVLHDTAGCEVEIYWESGVGTYGADGETLYGKRENGSPFYRLLFGENKLIFDMYLLTTDESDGTGAVKAVAGIREICELIPEFVQ